MGRSPTQVKSKAMIRSSVSTTPRENFTSIVPKKPIALEPEYRYPEDNFVPRRPKGIGARV